MKKACINMINKCCNVLWTKVKNTQAKWKTVLWPYKSKFDIFGGKTCHDAMSSDQRGEGLSILFIAF